MRSRAFPVALSTVAALLVGCDSGKPVEPSLVLGARGEAQGAVSASTSFATLGKLPSAKGGSGGEAYAVNAIGSTIAGYSWGDRAGTMVPVTWKLQNGAWTITALPYATTATSAVARAVNTQGDVAGNDFPASSPHAVLWSAAGGFSLLGCGQLGQVYGMSASGQTLVGGGQKGVSLPLTTAAVWRPGSCREDLPPLVAGGTARAYATNGDASIVGGSAAPVAGAAMVPVRWRRSSGAWLIEKLDSRPGTVFGANAAGDLTGYVQVACATASSCNRGIIWYAAGGSRELGTLGGGSTTPRAINAAREVVGLSTLSSGAGTAFFWSPTLGMRQLPVTGGAWAFAISGVRADGTRLVVGAGGQPFSPLVWVVRNP